MTIVSLGGGRRAAHGLRLRGAARLDPAAAAAHRLGPRPRRRLRVDQHRRGERLRRLPVPHVLHAAEPRLLADEDGRRVPADDRADLHRRADAADPRAAAGRRAADHHDRDGARRRRDARVLRAADAVVDLRRGRPSGAADHRRRDAVHLRAVLRDRDARRRPLRGRCRVGDGEHLPAGRRRGRHRGPLDDLRQRRLQLRLEPCARPGAGVRRRDPRLHHRVLRRGGHVRDRSARRLPRAAARASGPAAAGREPAADLA